MPGLPAVQLRQVGTVLGVAGLVAILAHVDRTDPLARYQHGAVLIVAFFAAAGVVAAGLLTARAPRAARPVRPAREALPSVISPPAPLPVPGEDQHAG